MGTAHSVTSPEVAGTETEAAVAGGRDTEMRRRTRVLLSVVSVLLLIVLWELFSIILGEDVLPRPGAVVAAIPQGAEDGYLWSDMASTLYRVLGAFGIALVISVSAGALLGWSRVAERLFGPWVTVSASVPALIPLVVALIALGLNSQAAMVGTSIVVAPLMTYAVWDGMKAIDPEYQEMARAFGMPKAVILRRVVLPQTLPFVFTAGRLGLSLSWRIMIFAELLGLSSGVGYRIQFWYSVFDMERVLAAALPFVLLMLALEFGVLRPAERRIFGWRKEEMR
jgi:NitT/TauT family transport system permease protein